MARPSTPILSAEKIAQTALELVDVTGEFTVGAVADRLGVRPSSLYNHVSGRDDIVEGMRTLAMSEVALALDAEAAWDDDAFPRLLRAYRDAFARHRDSFRRVGACHAHVWGHGHHSAEVWISDELLLDAISITDSYVIGAALDVAAPDEVWDSGAETSEAMHAAIAAAPTGRARADRSFDLGLRVVLDGVRRLAVEPRE